MLWSDRHPDRAMSRLAAGLLDPSERIRLADHARGCSRCQARYQHAVQVERTLAVGDPLLPSESEVSALELRGLQAALNAAHPAGERAPWWRPLVILAAASAAAVIMVFSGPKIVGAAAQRSPDEFATRGADAKTIHLRVFCAPPNGQLSEIVAGATCPRGSTVAFAGGAAGGMGVAVVSIRGGGKEIQSPQLPVRGGLGSEAPLGFTPVLDLPEGPAQLVAGFGASEAEARDALSGSVHDRIRTIDFVVGATP